jgi:hypothetical protein
MTLPSANDGRYFIPDPNRPSSIDPSVPHSKAL